MFECLVVNNELISNALWLCKFAQKFLSPNTTQVLSHQLRHYTCLHHHLHPPPSASFFFSFFFTVIHICTPTHPHVNTSTRQHICTSTHPHANTSVRQHICMPTHPHANASVHIHTVPLTVYKVSTFFLFFVYTYLHPPPPSAVITICVSMQPIPIPLPLSECFFCPFFILICIRMHTQHICMSASTLPGSK